MTLRLLVLFVVLGLNLAVYGAKDREWQVGKVTEVSSERFGVGNAGKLGVILGQPHATHDKAVTYTIQAENVTYVAGEMSMAHHKLKEQRFQPNENVKFALQGETKIVLLGSDGKEYKMELLKRTMK